VNESKVNTCDLVVAMTGPRLERGARRCMSACHEQTMRVAPQSPVILECTHPSRPTGQAPLGPTVCCRWLHLAVATDYSVVEVQGDGTAWRVTGCIWWLKIETLLPLNRESRDQDLQIRYQIVNIPQWIGQSRWTVAQTGTAPQLIAVIAMDHSID